MSNCNSGNIVIRSDEPTKIRTGSDAQADMLVHRVAEKLQSVYPNCMWHITMPADHSVITIRCLNAGGVYGYILHTMNVQNDPDLKSVVMAGGEIMERAGLDRSSKFTKHSTFSDGIDVTGAVRKHKNHNGIVKVI